MTSAPADAANGRGNDRQYRRLSDLLAGDPDDAGRRLRQVLEVGADRFGVELGLLMQVDPEEERGTIIEVSAPQSDLPSGHTGDLLSTYCRMVIAEHAPLVVDSVPKHGGSDAAQPAVLGTYIGTAVQARGQGYGAVCFVDPAPRSAAFGDEDRSFLARLAQAVEEVLGQQAAGEGASSPARTRSGGRRRWVRTVEGPVGATDGVGEEGGTARQEVSRREDDERRYREVIGRVTDAIVEVDADWRFTLVNDQAEELCDMAEEDLLGKCFWTVFSEALDTRFEEVYRQVMRTREPNSLVEHYPQLDGWFDIQVYPNDDGGIAFYFQEITRQKKKEEALRRQRNLLEQTQRLAGGWEIDLRTGQVSWSEKVYQIHELPPGTEVTIEEGIAFYAPEVRPRIREAFERCTEDGVPYDLELPIVTARGNRRWVRTVGAPTEEEEGQVVKVAGAFQDITDRKEAEQELREREARLRGLANSIPGVVFQFFVRPDGTYGNHFVSEHAQSVLGIPPDPDTFFERAVQQVPPSHRDRLEDSIEQAVAEETPWYIEVPFDRPDGERVWILGTSTPQCRDEELVFNGVLLDITERKEAERKLRDAKETAEEAARLKTAMLSNLSHEVRTPLTSMIGFSGLLKRRLEGKSAKLARLVHNSGQRLEKTMEAVLQLSQLEGGAYELDREAVPIGPLAREVVETFQVQAEQKDVDVTVRGDSVAAYGDRTAVRQILSNLLDNAIKFTPGGGQVAIRARTVDSEAIVLEVEDTGVGIAEDALPNVFKPFKQESEGLTREYQGVGIGLSIVLELVEVLGGEIDVHTEKEKGTCFSVRLPRAPGESTREK